MTATTSHNETDNHETNMHRITTWALVFSMAYSILIYWWTNSFHFSTLLQVLTPETTQYLADRTRTLNEARAVYWWQPIMDIVGPIITIAGSTYAVTYYKKLAEFNFSKKHKSKKKTDEKDS